MADRFALILCVFLGGTSSAGDQPLWVKDHTLERHGRLLTLVCDGEGSDTNLARTAALKGCLGVASSYLANTFRVKTLTVATENDAALHEEITQEHLLLGLECQSKNEYIDRKTDGSVRVFIQCDFDTSKVVARSVDKDAEPQRANQEISDSFIINVASSPACESIFIIGANSRIVRCDSNPVHVPIHPGDKELLIRAFNFKPQSITIKPRTNYEDTYAVFLER